MQIKDVLQTFSARESAEILGSSVEQVEEMVRSGRLRGAIIGKDLRIPAYALASLFEDPLELGLIH